MRFNGVDLNQVHSAISRSTEVMPGMAAREIATAETAGGELVVGLTTARDEYAVRVNISARTYEEAVEARTRLAAWAASSGSATAALEPEHAPGRAYQAIVKSVGKLEKRFTTVDVVFLLPKPVMYEMTPQIRTARGAEEISLMVGGSAEVQPVIRWEPSTTAEAPKLSLDGVVFFGLSGTVPAGKTLEVNLEKGTVTVDGQHAENRVLFTITNPDAALSPGRHTLRASAAGTWDVRWHNQWQ